MDARDPTHTDNFGHIIAARRQRERDADARAAEHDADDRLFRRMAITMAILMAILMAAGFAWFATCGTPTP